METAGAAVERLLDLDDESFVRQRAEAKGGDGGAVDRGDRRIDSRGEMHGGRVVDIVHGGVFHQGGGLQEAKFSAKVDRGFVSGPDLFAQLLVGGCAEEVDGVALRYLLEKGGPLFFWILLGEPDGGGRDGDIGFGLIGVDFFFIACRRIKVGFGRLIVRERGNKGLVPFDLMAVTDDMRDLFGEEKAEGVLVKADRNGCAGKGGEEAGGGESLNIDHDIVPGSTDATDQVVEVPQLMFAFFPDQDFMEERMTG